MPAPQSPSASPPPSSPHHSSSSPPSSSPPSQPSSSSSYHSPSSPHRPPRHPPHLRPRHRPSHFHRAPPSRGSHRTRSRPNACVAYTRCSHQRHTRGRHPRSSGRGTRRRPWWCRSRGRPHTPRPESPRILPGMKGRTGGRPQPLERGRLCWRRRLEEASNDCRARTGRP